MTAPLVTGSKLCTKCQQVKPADAFHHGAGKMDKYWCVPCKRAYNREWLKNNPESRRNTQRKTKYGLSPEAFAALLAEQDGKCALCLTDLEPNRSTHVDHDHENGEVRGLLCHKCNLALGYYEYLGRVGALERMDYYLG